MRAAGIDVQDEPVLARVTELVLALQPAAAQDVPDPDAPLTPFSNSSSRMSFSNDRRCAFRDLTLSPDRAQLASTA